MVRFLYFAYPMKFLTLLIFMCFQPIAVAQSYSVTKLKDITLKSDTFMGADNFQNLYYTSKSTLYKKSDKGVIEFAALNLGQITSVDLINPLKLTVFYKESNTVVILDNTLAEIRRINFSMIENFRNVSHATNGGDRRLWIFNTDIQRLELFDYNQNKVITEFPPTSFPALELTSNFNVCWVKTQNSIDSYTVYGSLINSYPIDEQIHSVTEYRDHIFVVSGEKLYYKEKDAKEFINIEIPEIKIKQFSIKDEILYIYDGLILTSFRLNLSKE
jgi:ABC-type sugar transport system permease subunit